MRIVGGRWRGRTLHAPKGRETRPTSDRVREGLFAALFSLLGIDLGSAVVLDAFAGSGALGLEALSRGASRAVLVESDASAVRAMRENVAALAAERRVQIVAADISGPVLDRVAAAGPYSLLLLDPPYRIERAVLAGIILRLREAGAVASGAVIALEHSSDMPWEPFVGMETIKTYRYGTTSVTLMREVKEGGPVS